MLIGNEDRPWGLNCNYLKGQPFLTDPFPWLGWHLPAGKCWAEVTAYQVQVATTLDSLVGKKPNLWDSGKVPGTPTRVRYEGKSPGKVGSCFWRVRCWGAGDRISNWSLVGVWHISFAAPCEWSGDWIEADLKSAKIEPWIENATSDPQIAQRMRNLVPVACIGTAFELPEKPLMATLRYCLLGCGDVWLNRTAVDAELMNPVPSDFEKLVFYNAIDVTDLMREGINFINFRIGDGFYAQKVVWGGEFDYGNPALKACLHLYFSDGFEREIITDENWSSMGTGTLGSNFYIGELHDARYPSFHLRAPKRKMGWSGVRKTTRRSGRWQLKELPGMEVVQSFDPIASWFSPDGIGIVYDLGFNFCGRISIQLQEEEGTAITFKYAEWLNSDRSLNFESTGVYATGVVQTDLYVAGGGGDACWAPSFAYHGFRYVEVRGLCNPGQFRLRGESIRTALKRSAEFTCSDNFLVELHEIAVRSMESNLLGMVTDCPHREKCGWIGDLHANIDTWCLEFEMGPLLLKIIHDMQVSTEEGLPGAIAGGKRICGRWLDWGAGTILIPDAIFRYYGNHPLLAEHLTYMLDYARHAVASLKKRISIGAPPIEEGSWRELFLGDWYDSSLEFNPDRNEGFSLNSESYLVGTLVLCLALQRLAVVSQKLDPSVQIEWIRSAVEDLKHIVLERYMDEETFSTACQTGDALMLACGFSPHSMKTAMALASQVKESGYRILCGLFGQFHVFDQLARNGYLNTAVRSLCQDGFGTFRSIVKMGATTLWERLDEIRDGDEVPERSLNHHMFVGYDHFLHVFVGGLQLAEDFSVSRQALFRWAPITGVRHAESRQNTSFGEFSSSWRLQCDDTLEWDIEVPNGATAMVFLPESTVSLALLNGCSPVDCGYDRHGMTAESGIFLKPGRHRVSLSGEVVGKLSELFDSQ